jgi:hypothetical protein
MRDCNAELTEEERAVFRFSIQSKALAFYEELRRELDEEYTEGQMFSLPAKLMAKRELLAGHRNEKLYLRLTTELIRLGLIVKVLPAGFRSDKSRRPALYVFSHGSMRNEEVLSLSRSIQRRLGRVL